MRSYWLWLLFNGIAWGFAIVFLNESIDEMAGRLLGAAFFFAIFFSMPLASRHPLASTAMLSVNAVIVILTLFPWQQQFNPYLILILSLLLGEAFHRLALRLSAIVGIIGTAGLSIVVFNADLSLLVQIAILIYTVFLVAALIHYTKTEQRVVDLEARYDTLLSEYRAIKRRLASDEEMARQEERMLIGHEIHDSVGHKLTALLVQLEGFRLKASETDKEQIQLLKELAQQGLEETRTAVKTLKSTDPGGLPGILRLIRKLELESFIRIQFSVRHGAFTARLTGEQSFAIYRSVQEALTNMMKHSHAREAEIMFEAPGGSIYRFEVSNPVTDARRYREGYGITAMRERLEKLGGGLEVRKTAERFVVSGYLRLSDGGDSDDSDTAG